MLSIAMNYPRPFDAQEFRSRDQSRNHPQTGGELQAPGLTSRSFVVFEQASERHPRI